MTTVYLGLGSNLAKPQKQILSAINEISELSNCNLLCRSSLYQTKAEGGVVQDDFINAVLAIKTSLKPLELLDVLQEIEVLHQRKRTIRWGPRTLDIDILLYGNAIINNTRLQIPHKLMTERGFVLLPLMEIAPELIIPTSDNKSEKSVAILANSLIKSKNYPAIKIS